MTEAEYLKSIPVKSVIAGKRETDYLGGQLPYEVRLPSGDWRPFAPIGEKQKFKNLETLGCTGYSNNNLRETTLKFLTGEEFNFSDRALNQLAGVIQGMGNYLYKPADVARKHGVILESDWSQPAEDSTISWMEYYKPIPPHVIDKLIKLDEAYEWVNTDKKSLEFHLRQAPLQLAIPAVNPVHAVVLLAITDSTYWIYDSYSPYLKAVSNLSIDSALKIVVKLPANRPEEVYKKYNDPLLYQKTGNVLIPIYTEWAFYLQDYIGVQIKILEEEEFNRYKISNLNIKSWKNS